MPTTVSLDEDVKQRLESLRHPDHDDWNDVVETIVGVLPSYDAIGEDGCKNCGGGLHEDAPLDQSRGYIHWSRLAAEYGGGLYTEWYCSRSCLEAGLEEQDKYAPNHPDRVVVGGHEQPRVELTDATFGMDGAAMWVGLDVPGAFSGKKRHSGEFSYEGEPVYVQNRGEWVHTGVIESIFHEEGSTSLDLDTFDDDGRIRLNHPEEEIRERQRADYMVWLEGHCESCDAGYRFPANEPPEECAECGSGEIENEELDEDELTDVQIEALSGKVPGVGDPDADGAEA